MIVIVTEIRADPGPGVWMMTRAREDCHLRRARTRMREAGAGAETEEIEAKAERGGEEAEAKTGEKRARRELRSLKT